MKLKGKKAYICSPLTAKDEAEQWENMMAARKYMLIVKQLYGCKTYAPHAYLPRLVDDSCQEERELALSFGISLLKICDALIVCGHIISSGMRQELEVALEEGKEIYHFVDLNLSIWDPGLLREAK